MHANSQGLKSILGTLTHSHNIHLPELLLTLEKKEKGNNQITEAGTEREAHCGKHTVDTTEQQRAGTTARRMEADVTLSGQVTDTVVATEKHRRTRTRVCVGRSALCY